MTEHTPTPWKLKYHDNAGGLNEWLLDAEGNHVKGVFLCDSFYDERGAANAALIVRAVNSHAALRAALESLIKYAVWQVKDGADYHPTMPSAIEAARRALAEA